MNLDHANALIVFVAGVLGLLGVVAGWVKIIHPRLRNGARTWDGIKETILGRDAVIDKATGRQLVPAQPGMANRLASLETTVRQIADQQVILNDHERRITDLEKGRVERVATQIENAAMWQGVASLTDADEKE